MHAGNNNAPTSHPAYPYQPAAYNGLPASNELIRAALSLVRYIDVSSARGLRGRGEVRDESGLLSMTSYTVAPGDCLSSIAKGFGLPGWESIYNFGPNDNFRRLRPDPNVILSGDHLLVPDRTLREDAADTDQRHQFELAAFLVSLRLILLDEDLQPLPGTPYRLRVGNSVFEGQTNSDGLMEHSIPPDAERAFLSVKVKREQGQTGYSWDLLLGMLDPVTTTTGLQARLNNPLKQLSVSMEINKKPSRNAKTDDFGRIYPLAGDIDEVTVKVTDSHESGAGDALATESGPHFERGGDGPRAA